MIDHATKARIVASWLNNMRLDYIATVENVPLDAVKSIIEIAARVPKRNLELKRT